MPAALWWRRWRQRWRSRRLRRRGLAQPDPAEIRAARERVAQSRAGSCDGGLVQRDLCLARGYCCRCACRYCPWGFTAPAARGHDDRQR